MSEVGVRHLREGLGLHELRRAPIERSSHVTWLRSLLWRTATVDDAVARCLGGELAEDAHRVDRVGRKARSSTFGSCSGTVTTCT